MQSPFIVNPDLTLSNLKDAIHGTLNKAKAILTCAMFSIDFIRDDIELEDHTLYHALWAADDCLNNLAQLLLRLEREAVNAQVAK